MISSHGKPAAVVLSPERYEGLLEEIEEPTRPSRRPRIPRGEPTMPFDKLIAELGLN
ncbi:RelB-like antitoxin [Mycobacterium phage Mask]|nr:RelB-like antitoxin [Mycobacterium phage Mask]